MNKRWRRGGYGEGEEDGKGGVKEKREGNGERKSGGRKGGERKGGERREGRGIDN